MVENWRTYSIYIFKCIFAWKDQVAFYFRSSPLKSHILRNISFQGNFVTYRWI